MAPLRKAKNDFVRLTTGVGRSNNQQTTNATAASNQQNTTTTTTTTTRTSKQKHLYVSFICSCLNCCCRCSSVLPLLCLSVSPWLLLVVVVVLVVLLVVVVVVVCPFFRCTCRSFVVELTRVVVFVSVAVVICSFRHGCRRHCLWLVVVCPFRRNCVFLFCPWLSLLLLSIRSCHGCSVNLTEAI